ncbi:MAG: TonB-dependent receptor, partial [Pseudohongiella sp.]
PRSQINREDMEIELGNPDLDPYKSTNFDLLADWYYGNSGVISAGVFHKDIDDYIVDFSTTQNPEFAGFEVDQPINGTKASVTGIEFNVQQGFEMFNESLMGFLAGLNLTALDTDLEIDERAGESFALPEAAERSGNFYVGYENELFSARLSVSYRDKFLSEVGDTEQFDLYVAPHTQVDMTASYRFSPRFELVAELTNLTDEALELYQGSKNFTYQFEEYGPTFAIGFKGQF